MIAAKPKPKRSQRTKHDIGLCGYCRYNMARQMVKIKHGPNAEYRRWMCERCLSSRLKYGDVKPSARPNQYYRTR